MKLRVNKIGTKQELTFQTGASDGQKWAAAWSASNCIVLYSSDIGTRAYEITNDKIVEHMPDAAEAKTGEKAYEEKYVRKR